MIDSDANLNVRPVGPSFLVVDGNLLIFGPLYLTRKLRAISTSAANNLKGLGCFWSEVNVVQVNIAAIHDYICVAGSLLHAKRRGVQKGRPES